MDRNINSRRIFLFFLILSYIFSIPKAHAHNVNIFAYVSGDSIHTESYFHDGGKVANGEIEVFDSGGSLVNSGFSDSNGEYSFKIPKHDNLTIVLTASSGHRASFELKEEDIVKVKSPGEHREQKAIDSSGSVLKNSEAVGVEDIRRAIDEELARHLEPISRSIAELRFKKNPSFTEVLGGIGYILGIMGLIMYFKSKGRK